MPLSSSLSFTVRPAQGARSTPRRRQARPGVLQLPCPCMSSAPKVSVVATARRCRTERAPPATRTLWSRNDAPSLPCRSRGIGRIRAGSASKNRGWCAVPCAGFPLSSLAVGGSFAAAVPAHATTSTPRSSTPASRRTAPAPPPRPAGPPPAPPRPPTPRPGGHSGSYELSHWSASAYTVDTYQTITGLTDGDYTLGVWVPLRRHRRRQLHLAAPAAAARPRPRTSRRLRRQLAADRRLHRRHQQPVHDQLLLEQRRGRLDELRRRHLDRGLGADRDARRRRLQPLPGRAGRRRLLHESRAPRRARCRSCLRPG